MELIIGYKENHGLEFPSVPAAPLLFLHIRDLALPRTFIASLESKHAHREANSRPCK